MGIILGRLGFEATITALNHTWKVRCIFMINTEVHVFYSKQESQTNPDLWFYDENPFQQEDNIDLSVNSGTIRIFDD